MSKSKNKNNKNKGTKLNKKQFKKALQFVDKKMDSIITKIGKTDSNDEKSLIYKIECLNEDCHDTESIMKAYKKVNTKLENVQQNLIMVDLQMRSLQTYYDKVIKATKK